MHGPRPEIKIGPSRIGEDVEPLFLPDIDVYFKRDLKLAFRIVDQLAEAGCRFIKVAALHEVESCLPGYNTRYWAEGRGFVEEEYRAILERHILPLHDLAQIMDYARRKGLAVAISVYDKAGVDFAVERGCELLKIPSSNIVHAPLIRDAVRTGIPLVIDTGRSAHDEVERAVSWARGVSEVQSNVLIIQHSPPGPPAPSEEASLKTMLGLGEAFGTYFGLSDHANDDTVMLAAAAMDADIIETGIKPRNDTADDIDTAHALSVNEVGALLEKLKTIHYAARQGGGRLQRPAIEPQDRMGLVAKQHLKAGDIIRPDNVSFAFPAIGVSVARYDDYMGAVVVRDVGEGSPILSADVEGRRRD